MVQRGSPARAVPKINLVDVAGFALCRPLLNQLPICRREPTLQRCALLAARRWSRAKHRWRRERSSSCIGCAAECQPSDQAPRQHRLGVRRGRQRLEQRRAVSGSLARLRRGSPSIPAPWFQVPMINSIGKSRVLQRARAPAAMPESSQLAQCCAGRTGEQLRTQIGQVCAGRSGHQVGREVIAALNLADRRESVVGAVLQQGLVERAVDVLVHRQNAKATYRPSRAPR